jgi:predicted TIM-barrel fold metal-dependent hydrolase
MDVDALVAIDMHTHVHASVHGPVVTAADAATPSAADAALTAMGKYFKADDVTALTVQGLAAYYRERSMACVTFTVDTFSVDGRDPMPSNEEIAELAEGNADVVIPFASVDPARGAAGVRMARTLIEEHGVKGFKFHPSMQRFFPNDRAAYGLYEVIAGAGLPALFHTGQTGAGAGTRGGGGVRLKYANPLHLDDVAVDFPDMPIVMAHPSFPWQEEAISVALHKPQVYIDLSGWSPKYFPPILVQYANTLLKDKVLFGTDYPMLTPQRWLADFDETDIRDSVKPGILKLNAARLLGLTGDR